MSGVARSSRGSLVCTRKTQLLPLPPGRARVFIWFHVPFAGQRSQNHPHPLPPRQLWQPRASSGEGDGDQRGPRRGRGLGALRAAPPRGAQRSRRGGAQERLGPGAAGEAHAGRAPSAELPRLGLVRGAGLLCWGVSGSGF